MQIEIIISSLIIIIALNYGLIVFLIFKIHKMKVSSLCDKSGIKIKECQLGAF